jgi:hypothetical protein
MQQHHHSANVSFASSNPTIQPPPNLLPMTNVNELNDIPCFWVPANHPMFTEYFSKQAAPTSPSPDPRDSYQPQQSYPHQQDQLNQALDESRLCRQGDEDRKNVATIINAALNQIRARNKLLADGSNFRKWNQHIQELAYQFISNPDFFIKQCTNTHNEKIGRAMLLNSVDPLLKDELTLATNCVKIYSNLSACFSSVCRSAQVSTFVKLLQLKPKSFETVSAFALELRDTISKLKSLNLSVTKDSLMGLILQMNLCDGPVKDEFMPKVKSTMNSDPLHKTPRFDELMKVLYVCKRQISFSAPETSISSIISAPPSLHHLAVSLPTEDPSTLHEPTTTVDAQALCTGNCHICQQPGHWSADCPHRKKPVPTCSHQNNTPKFHVPPYPYNHSPGDHPYCPIVVAPNFLLYGAPYQYPNNFPHSQFPSQIQPPRQQITQSKNSAPNERPYESYKPNYTNRTPPTAARNVDVGSIEDEIAELQIAGEATADAIGTNTKIILDTGASSHLTGDRSALFDFQVLSKPIPLRVATDGCNDFITRTGTMIFPGSNATTFSVKGVMYCENARSTLILPAALQRAKMIIDYNSLTDTFLFKSPLGKTLIESPH